MLSFASMLRLATPNPQRTKCPSRGSTDVLSPIPFNHSCYHVPQTFLPTTCRTYFTNRNSRRAAQRTRAVVYTVVASAAVVHTVAPCAAVSGSSCGPVVHCGPMRRANADWLDEVVQAVEDTGSTRCSNGKPKGCTHDVDPRTNRPTLRA